jgi:prolyl-tRNA synthetase
MALGVRMYSHIALSRCAPSSRAVGRLVHTLPRNLSTTCSRSISSSSTIQRLSRFWIPTVGAERSKDAKDESHELLIRAGYLRQAHAGIFHMLPLGNRVQQKLEALIDKHMESIGMHSVYGRGRRC